MKRIEGGVSQWLGRTLAPWLALSSEGGVMCTWCRLDTGKWDEEGGASTDIQDFGWVVLQDEKCVSEKKVIINDNTQPASHPSMHDPL